MFPLDDPPSPPSSGGRRGRGRPSVIDSGAVAEAAFKLWRERGFAETSWADLAEATGVSARTLLRHFHTKADIAWIGVAYATERLRGALEKTSAADSLADAIRTGVVSSVSHHPRVQRVNPAWLRLIADEPELLAMAPRAYRPWIDELAAFIGRRVPHALPRTGVDVPGRRVRRSHRMGRFRRERGLRGRGRRDARLDRHPHPGEPQRRVRPQPQSQSNRHKEIPMPDIASPVPATTTPDPLAPARLGPRLFWIPE